MKWPGNKHSEIHIPLVRNSFPASFTNYFEPFLGSGAVYFSVNFSHAFCGDISIDLINLFTYLKNQDVSFFEVLSKINEEWKVAQQKDTTRHVFSEFRSLFNQLNPGIVRTAYFAFLREFSYAGMFRYNQKGEYNSSFGGSYRHKTLDSKLRKWRNPLLLNHLKKTNFENLDFQKFLELYRPTDSDFIFLDPPYDQTYTGYMHSTFSEDDHQRLQNFLLKTPARFLMLVSDTALMRTLYESKFTMIPYPKNYAINFRNRNKRNTEHLLIKNY